jgi:hypothetical protein
VHTVVVDHQVQFRVPPERLPDQHQPAVVASRAAEGGEGFEQAAQVLARWSLPTARMERSGSP